MRAVHTAAVLSTLLSLNIALPASAKFSTSIALCFAPNDVSVTPAVSERLAQFVDRAKLLGNPSGLLVLTVAERDLESEGQSKSRVKLLLSHLNGLAIGNRYTEVRQVQQSSSNMGCSAKHIAVELEIVFPHDGYR